MKKSYGILFFYLFLLFSLSAQQDVQQILSPEVLAITKYGNFPISLYRGEIDISLPIYEIKEKGVTLPITLQYDASGLLPARDASIVGQNWNIVCGGRVTRLVKGIADENLYPSYGDYMAQKTDNMGYLYGIRNSSIYGEPRLPSYLLNITNNFKQIDGMMRLDLNYEHEPDLFTVQIGTTVFNFMIDNRGDVQVLYSASHKVDISRLALQRSGFPYSNSSIRVTTDDGYIYEFGGNENTVELSYPLDYSSSNRPIRKSQQCVVNAWYLTKITHPSGEAITLEYKSQIPNLPDDQDANYIEKEIYFTTQTKRSVDAYLPLYAYGIVPDFNMGFIQKPYLSRVKARLATVDFQYSLSTHNRYGSNEGAPYSVLTKALPYYKKPTYQLDSIVVSNPEERVLVCGFTYKNIRNISNNPLAQNSSRRFLTNISINQQLFKFDYNDTTVPAPLVMSYDLQAYYNANNKNYLTPQNNDPLYPNYGHRSPNAHYADAGLLKRVTYPTGGYTCFDYEQHRCGYVVEKEKYFTPGYVVYGSETEDRAVGGARIKKVLQSTGDSTEYIYGSSQKRHTGVYLAPPTYGYNYWAKQMVTGDVYGCGFTAKPTSIYEGSSVPEPCVGYSFVQQKLADGSKVNYYYTNFLTHPDVPLIFPHSFKVEFEKVREDTKSDFRRQMTQMLTYSSCAQERGKLIKKEIFDQSGVKVAQEEFTYNNSPDRSSLLILGSHVAYASDMHGMAYTYGIFHYPNPLVSTKNAQ